MMRFRVCLILAVMLALPVFLPRAAGAALIPGIDTLADLIATGQQGVTVNDVRYYDFQYSYNGSTTPRASQIAVDPLPQGLGLVFGANWRSANGVNQTSSIRFRAEAGSSINHFAGVTSLVNGTVIPSNRLAQLSETDTVYLGTTPVISLLLADDGTASASNQTSRSYQMASPVTDLRVVKTLALRSTTGALPTADVSTTSVQFLPIHLPEPGEMLALVSTAVFVAMRRSR